jgi:hypothetical protein
MDFPSQHGVSLDRFVANPRVRATYASVLAHVTVFLVLAMWAYAARPPVRPPIQLSIATVEPADGRQVEFQGESGFPQPPARGGTLDVPPAEAVVHVEVPPPVTEVTANEIAIPEKPRSDGGGLLTMMASVVDTLGPQGPPSADSSISADTSSAAHTPAGESRSPYAGRGGDKRSQGVSDRGGSVASEAAVERGLAWLARHQAVDGSWRFDLSGCGCDGACSHPGTVTSTTASTGIVLLPFLGAGHTHADGAHRETVTRGLYYLMSRLRPTPRGGDLSEGTMYGHGVATLALAEAYGMTGDAMLAPYVRDAIRFIETSQDMHGGGWRYLPGQAGDTTVTAWQIAALKSAALTGAAVPSPTIDAACRFLDRVQVRKGEGYGYLSPQDRSCTSAVGLLCRIYTAWPEVATLDRGLARLARAGPQPEAVYENFYLSQALLLREHPAWRRWNARNRDHLVARQMRAGHEAGSWTFADSDTAPGGRLGHTALAVLTLEVYYRMLPIYSERAATTGW